MKTSNSKFLLVLFSILVLSCSKGDDDLPPDIDTPDEPGQGQEQVGQTNFFRDNTFKAAVFGSCEAAAVQPDGKIIITGSFGQDFQFSNEVYRLNVDGSKDETFDIDVDKSWTVTSFGDVEVLSDGKILLSGSYQVNGAPKFLIRLNQNGALDRSFSQPNTITSIRGTFKQPDGKILISGHNTFANGISQQHLLRLNNDGSVDNSFGSWTANDTGIADIVFLPDGKLLIAGSFYYTNGSRTTRHIARLNSNGALDPSFNFTEHIGHTQLGGDYIGSVSLAAVQSDGKILIAGEFNGVETLNVRDSYYGYNRILRLNSDGSLDATFSTESNLLPGLSAINVMPDNQILIASTGILGTSGQDYLTLLDRNGKQDPSFQLGYKPVTYVNQVIKESDKSYLIVGRFGIDDDGVLEDLTVIRIKVR